MNFNKAVVAICLLTGIISGCAEEKSSEKNSFYPQLKAATDARDEHNPVFDLALQAEEWSALPMLGQIGGIGGCGKLVRFLASGDSAARLSALEGAAYCYGGALDGVLMDQLLIAETTEEINKILIALGFIGGPDVTPIVLKHFDPQNAASVYALLQHIAYKRLLASELQALPFDGILDAIKNSNVAFENAYLLTRIRALDEVYTLEQMKAALGATDDQAIQKLLVRVVAQFGNAAADVLLTLARADAGPTRTEAVRAMGQLSNTETKEHLVSLLEKGTPTEKQLAIAAFASRNLDDIGITARIEQLVKAPEHGVAAAALTSLMVRSPEQARLYATEALTSDVYYLAYKAINSLAQSEEGRQLLKGYAETHKNTVRGHDAQVALDPQIKVTSITRPTATAEQISYYQNKLLKLQTSKGDITITMVAEAPYTSTSFMQLAESGKMDGMLWHRVIPNFVAQAGQIEDASLNDWGNIRSEWFASDHKIGTVGLATLGKDTGSTQFFINTAYNLHLNGHYTVFGRVSEGLDVALALEEGDIIERAEIIDAP